jgi:uncharacterized Zn finger protein
MTMQKNVNSELSELPAQKEHRINIKCRNSKCSSIVAVEIKVLQKYLNVYRCVECGKTWVVPIGGPVDI